MDDGLLTALEVGDLDLSGVDLVVLSACETGLGQLDPVDGPLGLNRALHQVGARTCVTSLWPVNDAATADLMRLFFHNLLVEKKGKLEAFCEAQRAVLKQSSDEMAEVQRGGDPIETIHVGAPYFWAGFTLSGEW
jgi:CHAT domain-containing protein